MTRLRRHLSYANVVATLALIFAMSGGALAASHYLLNSTRQINPKVLKRLRGNVGASGKQGATGPPGPQGPTGPSTGPAGGDLKGNYPNPTIKAGAVTHADLGDSSICSISVAAPTNLTARSCKLEFGQAAAGVICLKLPFTPAGGSVTIDSGDPGFPVGYLSLDPTTIEKAGCDGTISSPNVVITTFDEKEKPAEEGFHAIFF